MSRSAFRFEPIRVAVRKSKRKLPGFQQIAECFGGIGCIYLRKAGKRVALKNSANGTTIIMSVYEWRQICRKKRRSEI